MSEGGTGQEVLETIVRQFDEQFGGTDEMLLAMAPGRVNLLGDYTDLNDGFVLPMTVDRGVYVALRKRNDDAVRTYSVRYGEMIEYPIGQCPAIEAGSWSSYVIGVVEELRQRGLISGGFEAVIDGNLNLGAGLSSSAALEVATATALQVLFGFPLEAVEMVRLCQYVEHSYAKVLCGVMDQFASRIGRKDHALFLDCRSLEYRSIPLVLGDYRIVIVSSGVKRSLATTAYNARRAECQQAVEFFHGVDPDVVALRDVSPEMFDEHRHELSGVVRQRCRHVIAENGRVLDAASLLSDSHLDEFGALMTASHLSLRDDFEVSCPELDLLVTLSNNTEGVLGARMTGAGFGGCTVNLVHEDAVQVLTERIEAEYAVRFGLTPGVFALQGNLEAGRL